LQVIGAAFDVVIGFGRQQLYGREIRDLPLDHAVFRLRAAREENGCGLGSSSEVGSLSPAGDTLDGVQDMAGNVRELTSSAPGPGSMDRVVRGGGWASNYSIYFQASYRLWSSPASANAYEGFRCAVDVVGASE